jgi:hypothetical protein
MEKHVREYEDLESDADKKRAFSNLPKDNSLMTGA